MSMVEFIVPGNVAAQPRPRAQVVSRPGRKAFAHIYTPDTAREWRQLVLLHARRAQGYPTEPWTGTVLVWIEAFFDRTKELQQARYPDEAFLRNDPPDADNVAKAILDALQPPRPPKGITNEAILRAHRAGYLFANDSHVHVECVRRLWAARGHGAGAFVRALHLPSDRFGPTLGELESALLTVAGRSTRA